MKLSFGFGIAALLIVPQLSSATSLTLPIIDESRHAIAFSINANYDATTDLLQVWGNINGIVNGDADIENLTDVRPVDIDLTTFDYIPSGTFKMDVHVDSNGNIVPGTQQLEVTYFDTSDVQHTIASSNTLAALGLDNSTQPQMQLRFHQDPADPYGENVGVLLYFGHTVDFSNDFNTSDLKADVFATVPTPASWAGGMALMGITGLVIARRRSNLNSAQSFN